MVTIDTYTIHIQMRKSPNPAAADTSIGTVIAFLRTKSR